MGSKQHPSESKHQELDRNHLKEFILLSLEHEMGGVKIYEAAVKVAQNDELKKEWEKFHHQTRRHVDALQKIAKVFGLDPQEQTPARKILASLGDSLVESIREAEKGPPAAAELVACEAIVLAETKDHLDWELLSEAVKELSGNERQTLRAACEEIEDEEDQHLYLARGWCRELWLRHLGMKAVLPPPEVRKHVKNAVEAAKTEQSRHH